MKQRERPTLPYEIHEDLGQGLQFVLEPMVHHRVHPRKPPFCPEGTDRYSLGEFQSPPGSGQPNVWFIFYWCGDRIHLPGGFPESQQSYQHCAEAKFT